MSTNPEYVAQVRITNTLTSAEGAVIPKVLAIKASKFKDYVQQLRLEPNGKYTPNRSEEYGYLPLLSLWDLADTGEQVFYDTFDDLPKETVFNSKGIPILIILPESDMNDIGLNRFDVLDGKTQEKIEKHLAEIPALPFKLSHKSKK